MSNKKHLSFLVVLSIVSASTNVFAAKSCQAVFAKSAQTQSSAVSAREGALKQTIKSYLEKIRADRRIWSEKDIATINKIETLLRASDAEVSVARENGQWVATGRSAEKLKDLFYSLEGFQGLRGDIVHELFLTIASYKTLGSQLSESQTFVSAFHVLTYLRAEHGLNYFGANGLGREASSAAFLTSRLHVLSVDLFNIVKMEKDLTYDRNSGFAKPETLAESEKKIDNYIKAIDERFALLNDAPTNP